MIVILLVMLAVMGIAGLIVHVGEENAGPLARMLSEATAEQFEQVQQVLVNVTLGLIFLHISAVLFASLAHH